MPALAAVLAIGVLLGGARPMHCMHSALAPRGVQAEHVVRLWHLTIVVADILTDRVGVYDGPCAEFCGTEHALMALRNVADPPERHAAWAARKQPPQRRRAPR